MITSFFSRLTNPKLHTNISVNALPGTHKKSFAMSYMGGEIWFEHLDGMYSYTEEVIQKFLKDIPNIAKTSAPSLIAVNLDDTFIDDQIIKIISDTYISNAKYLHKLVFVGLNHYSRNKMKKAFQKRNGQYQFAINYINDFEKAKEWLVGKGY
jgi:hypothetical protein